jgi:hypothetical protein
MKSFFRSTCCLIPVLLASSFSFAAASGKEASAVDAPHVQEIIDWVRNQGGYFNPKLVIRRADPTDSTSYLGVFATQYILPGEGLMTVPASCFVKSSDDDDEDATLLYDHNDNVCELTQVLINELNMGVESKFAPYVQYLLGQERGHIPATWTDDGKKLMIDIGGNQDKTVREMTSWIKANFEKEDCVEPGNAFAQQALALVAQRGWDRVLIPLYDMINHTNDLSKINADNTSVYGKEGITVWASRAIQAGEEIAMSYDECTDCQNIPEEWGTPEILRDFGFVEAYPQIFWFPEAKALFRVYNVVEDDDDDDDTHHLEIDWLGYESPRYEGIDWMKEEYQRLLDLQQEEGTLAKSRHLMPEKEWNTIVQYHQAITEALDVAIHVAIDDLADIDNGDKDYGIYEDDDDEDDDDDDYVDEDDDDE